MKPNLTFSKFAAFPVATALAVIILGISCQKSSVTENQSSDNFLNQQKLDVTNALVEASGSDEENFELVMEDENAEASNVSNAKVAESPVTYSPSKFVGRTVTYSPSKNVYPHTKTIDFGAGFTSANGVTKSGKIIITYYDAAADAQGKYSVTTYDNYYVNGSHIEGSIQVNKIKNGTGKDVYLHIIHRTISNAAGNLKDYNGNAKWTVIDWKGGTNNAYEIAAHTEGKETYNGIGANNFKTDIDDNNPVIKPFSCNNRVQGGLTAEIHLAKGKVKDLVEYIDYGNGECDNIATLSINGGAATEVTLPLHFWPLN